MSRAKDDITSVQLEADTPDPQGDTTLDEIGQYCRDLYQECKDSTYRQRKLTEREENRKRYRGERDPIIDPKTGKVSWRSNRSLMIDAIIIDNLEPRLMAQLFGDKDIVNPEPVGPEDEPKVKDVKEFLSWSLTSNIKIEEAFKPVLHDHMIDGTALALPVWHEEERINMIREPVPVFESDQGPVDLDPEQIQANPWIQQLLQQGVIRFAGYEARMVGKPIKVWKVKIEQIPLPDAYFPDTGMDWEQMPFLRMIYPLYHELVELSEENGGPYKNISEKLIFDQSRSHMEDADKDQQDLDVRHSEHSKECPLLECHVPWEGEWFLITFSIHAGWTEVRRQPMQEVYAHGRKAVQRFTLFRETNESMGTGISQKIKHFSTGADALYNQMVDNGTIENMPFGTIEEVAGSNRHYGFAPGRLTPVPRGANIQFPKFGGDSSRFMSFIELLIQMLERLISLMAFTQTGQINQGSAGSDTYAGMNLLAHEANIKHQYTGRGLRSRLEAMIKDILSLYGQYLPFDAQMRIFENDKYTFKPFDLQAIQGEYDIALNVSSSSGNAMLKRQETRELAEVMGPNPLVDQPWLATEILESYGIKDGKSKLKPEINQLVMAFNQDPGIMQAVQQYMQQKAEQQRIQEIEGQAQANIERQQIQRNAEMPYENQKIIDQTTESAKRKLVSPMVEQTVANQAMQGAI